MDNLQSVVHTWLDTEKSTEYGRPLFRSTVNIYPSWSRAYHAMKKAYIKVLTERANDMCAAHFHSDSAYIEYEKGNKEIWTLTSAVSHEIEKGQSAALRQGDMVCA